MSAVATTMKPNRITVSRSARGTTVKATGHAARVLFDRLAAEVDARLAPEPVGPCTVHFADHGQDFLEWDVDATGTVTDSRPYQAKVWRGSVLVATPVAGQQVRYRSTVDGQEHSIRYPVTKVVRVVCGVQIERMSP